MMVASEREKSFQESKVPALDEIEEVHPLPLPAQNVSRLQRDGMENCRKPVEVPISETLEERHGPEEALCAPVRCATCMWFPETQWMFVSLPGISDIGLGGGVRPGGGLGNAEDQEREGQSAAVNIKTRNK